MAATLESGDASTAAHAVAAVESIRALNPEELDKLKENVSAMTPDNKKAFVASYEKAKKKQPNFRVQFDGLVEKTNKKAGT